MAKEKKSLYPVKVNVSKIMLYNEDTIFYKMECIILQKHLKTTTAFG